MNFIGFGAMAVTKPYEFIGFGAMAVTKPYEFIGFGAMDTKSLCMSTLQMPYLRPRGRARHTLKAPMTAWGALNPNHTAKPTLGS